MATKENAASIAVEHANQHAINLARVEAGQVEEVKALLTDLEAKLATILIKGDIAPGKADKLAKIQEEAAKAIGKTYQGIAKQQELALTGVAEAQTKQDGKTLNAQLGGAASGVEVFGPVLTEGQWSAVSKKALIFGHSSGDWWASQDQALRFKFAGQMQEGYALGESVDEMVRRVRGTQKNGYADGIMQTSKREAEALVRSSVQTVSNAAKLAGFEQQGDLVKGIEWVSTFDTRTTTICRALSGKQWRLPDYEPIGHDKAFPGPTAHWNCRSTQIAILRSWAELSGKPIKALDGKTLQDKLQAKLLKKGMAPEQASKAMAGAKASMDGQIAGDMTQDDWLAAMPDEQARKILGPGRYKLWKDGKITTKDLTDQKNRPLTLAQLQAAIDGDGFPVETEGVEFLPGKPVEKFSEAPAPLPTAVTMDGPEPLYKVKAIATREEKIAAKEQFLAQIGQDPATNYSDLFDLPVTSNEKMILHAIFGQNGHILRDQDGKIIAAISWNPEGSPDNLMLDYVGSVGPKGGSQALKVIADQAAKEKKGIFLESLDQTSNTFYEKWGIKPISEDDGESFYEISATDLPTLRSKLEAYLTAKPAPAPVPAGPAGPDQIAASAKIAEILANPKGQTLKAAALAKLQKEQPDLIPSDMLAMAEGIAQEKQAAASKASVLSLAKKKLVAEETPTPAQWALLNSLPVEEQNAFLTSVDDAKAVQKAALKAAGDDADALEQLDQWTSVGGDYAEAVKLAKADAAPGTPASDIAAAADDYLMEITIGKQADAYDALTKIEVGEATKLKQAALKKFGPVAEISPDQAIEILAKVEQEAAEKQAAASKASILSMAKKKLVEGKDPTPAQQALIDSLPGEEAMAFYAAAKDAKTIEDAKKTGKVTIVEGIDLTQPAKQLDSKKGIKALKALPPVKGTEVEDWLEHLSDDELDGYAVNPLATGPPDDEVDTFSTKPDAEKALVPNQITTVKLADLLTSQPYIETKFVEQYIKSSSTESVNPTWKGKPPEVIKKDGKFHLVDGNHRATAWFLSGETDIPVLLYDLDATANLAEASPVPAGPASKALAGTAKALMTKVPNPKLVETIKAKLGFDPTAGADNQADVENMLAGWTKTSGKDLGELLAEAKAEVKAAAKLALKTTTTTAPDIKAKNLDLYVPNPADLVKVKDLSGSTRPILAQDPTTGKQWVVKSPEQGGGGPEHLQNEAAADAIYRIAGVPVPGSAYIDQDGKQYKVAEFLEGAKTLGQWEATATPAERDAVRAKISEHFVMDALMGNWDVAGQSNDNIMVMPDGTPVRVDNGGALDWRAMGKQKTASEWKATVDELKTLRDPSMAAGQTAQIFAGLTTGEIHNQIAAILTKRDDLVEAVRSLKGEKVAAVFKKRIDYLEKQLPAAMRKPTAEATKAQATTAGTIPKTVAKDIQAARINGVALPVGSTHVEDMQALTWKETTAQGKPVTVTHMKVTAEGNQAIQAAIGAKLATAPQATNSTITTGPISDPYKGPWVAMAKTLNTHKDDGQFNAGTFNNFATLYNQIEASLGTLKGKPVKTAADKAAIAQAEHYLALGDQLKATQKAYVDASLKGTGVKPTDPPPPFIQTTIFDLDQYTDDKPKKEPVAPVAPAADFTIQQRKEWLGRITEIKAANAKIDPTSIQTFEVDAGVYELGFPDGTTVQYIPRTGRLGKDARVAGLALEGTVQVRIPADADHDAVMKTVETLQKLGIDTNPATADYREITWLRKTAYTHNHQDKFDAAITGIQDPADQIAAARRFIEKTYKVKVPARGEEGYTADGVANSFGHGTRHVFRADLTPQAAEKELAGYALMHSPSTSHSMAKVIGNMLESGGEATTTTGRIRKGVDVSGTGGWSAQSDIRSGGADFFFTRIRKKEDIGGRHIAFKIRNIARTDVVSYSSDVFGETGRRTGRVSTVDKYKNLAAKGGSDETILKNGAFLLDEIDQVICSGSSERDEVLAMFKSHGVTKMTDGRPIEDVVVIK